MRLRCARMDEMLLSLSRLYGWRDAHGRLRETIRRSGSLVSATSLSGYELVPRRVRVSAREDANLGDRASKRPRRSCLELRVRRMRARGEAARERGLPGPQRVQFEAAMGSAGTESAPVAVLPVLRISMLSLPPAEVAR